LILLIEKDICLNELDALIMKVEFDIEIIGEEVQQLSSLDE